MINKREQWGSKLGFILAASGSAVGLGNIWKYPHMAGQNGGAAFTIVYLVCILVVGLPILLGELVIGRNTQLSPVGAFNKLADKSNWKWVGFLGVASAFVILSFYGVVGGWTLRYTVYSLSGGFESLSGNADASGEVFNSFISNSINPIFWQLLFMSVCIGIIIKGVKSGIEEGSKIMMPLIIVILGILVVRGLTLDGGSEGLIFLFKPKFSDLTPSSIVLALGHAFFTLSLGMGTMLTYGSYLDKKQNLFSSAIWVILLDTAIAMLAGTAIFTIVFAMGADPSAGAGLIFVVLPTIFPQIGGGLVWGTLFFFILFMAALTSAISILEVITAYFIDEKGWSRERATLSFGGVITIVGIFCSLSLGNFNITSIFDISFFDFMDELSSKYMLPIGGALTAIFILYKWGVEAFLDEIKIGMERIKIDWDLVKTISNTLFIVSALIVCLIILNEVSDLVLGISLQEMAGF
ncbi:MAG: sodium-dependent transporter [Candidatus Neomarinimicrobiota bacterium]|nr:sodium-dependent transporter [Candidatus Neomarinimicrobiota bacterium]